MKLHQFPSCSKITRQDNNFSRTARKQKTNTNALIRRRMRIEIYCSRQEQARDSRAREIKKQWDCEFRIYLPAANGGSSGASEAWKDRKRVGVQGRVCAPLSEGNTRQIFAAVQRTLPERDRSKLPRSAA